MGRCKADHIAISQGRYREMPKAGPASKQRLAGTGRGWCVNCCLRFSSLSISSLLLYLVDTGLTETLQILIR